MKVPIDLLPLPYTHIHTRKKEKTTHSKMQHHGSKLKKILSKNVYTRKIIAYL